MEERRDNIRLNTVRRIDPHVSQIVDSAPRTALYTYEQGGESWAKTEVEGTFMIYSRTAPPFHMITIINRLSRSNFTEALTHSCDTQVKPPYLLFKNTKGVIYGIWFSDAEDVKRISVAVKDKIDADVPSSNKPASSAPNIMSDPAVALAGTAGTGGDILSMLSRAQGEFESRRQEPRSIVGTVNSTSSDIVKPSPLRVQTGEQNGTSNTVADFFAKVSGAQAGSGMAGLSNAPLPSPSTQAAGATASGTLSSSPTTNPVLQKLFQGAAAVGGQATVHLNSNTTVPGSQKASAPISIPGASSNCSAQQASLSSSVPGAAPMSLQELEGRLKDNLRVSGSKEEEQIPLSPMQPSQGQQQHPVFSQPLTTTAEPSSLLSPQVFTTSRVATDPLHRKTPPLSIESPQNRTFPGLLAPGTTSVMDMHPLNGSQESLNDTIGTQPSQHHVTPLTQDQLAQALSMLLKKEDFIKQLHEAYVQVLNQSFAGKW